MSSGKLRNRRSLLFLALIVLSLMLSMTVMFSIWMFSPTQSIDQLKHGSMFMKSHLSEQSVDQSIDHAIVQPIPLASTGDLKPLISYQQLLNHLHGQISQSFPPSINQSLDHSGLTIDQSIEQSVDTFIDPWLYRFQPIIVEHEADFDWLNINILMLSGHLHHPLLFDGLPCISAYTIDPSYPVPAVNKSVKCTKEVLLLNPANSMVIATFIRPDGSILLENRWFGPMQASTVNYSTSFSINQSVSESLQHSIDTIQQTLFNRSTDNGKFVPTFEPLFHAMQFSNQKFMVRSRVPHLFSNPSNSLSYYYEIVIANGTHCTEPIRSATQSLNQSIKNKQLFLFKQEQARLTEYLNQITIQQTTLHSTSQSPFQPPHHFSLAVKPAEHRQLAPFEAYYGQCKLPLSPSGDHSTHQTFHQWIEAYRTWHDKQVNRLIAVKDDINALTKLFEESQMTNPSYNPSAKSSTDPPLRILNAGIYRWSGVTDRLNGWTGLYLIALLTNRVLLFDDDWPDLQRVLLSSLRVNRAAVAPLLKDASLVKRFTQDVPVSDVGPIVDSFDSFYTEPILQITSFKGIVMRIFTNSSYSGRLSSMGLTPENVLGCLYHSLWTMRLSSVRHSPDYEPLLRELLHPDSFGVGVQIRSWHDAIFLQRAKQAANQTSNHSTISSANQLITQSISTLKRGGTYGYFRCARDVSDTVSLTQTKQVKWFLMSDDDDIRQAALLRWGKTQKHINGYIGEPYLLSLLEPGGVGHSNAVDADAGLLYARHALVDQFLYSLCASHIISLSSGFGRIPALHAFRHKKIFVIEQQNITQKTSKSCMDEDTDGTDVMELSKQWSLV